MNTVDLTLLKTIQESSDEAFRSVQPIGWKVWKAAKALEAIGSVVAPNTEQRITDEELKGLLLAVEPLSKLAADGAFAVYNKLDISQLCSDILPGEEVDHASK